VVRTKVGKSKVVRLKIQKTYFLTNFVISVVRTKAFRSNYASSKGIRKNVRAKDVKIWCGFSKICQQKKSVSQMFIEMLGQKLGEKL
jgi:hypothetical protein